MICLLMNKTTKFLWGIDYVILFIEYILMNKNQYFLYDLDLGVGIRGRRLNGKSPGQPLGGKDCALVAKVEGGDSNIG
jgi:hypothetical protein